MELVQTGSWISSWQRCISCSLILFRKVSGKTRIGESVVLCLPGFCHPNEPKDPMALPSSPTTCSQGCHTRDSNLESGTINGGRSRLLDTITSWNALGNRIWDVGSPGRTRTKPRSLGTFNREQPLLGLVTSLWLWGVQLCMNWNGLEGTEKGREASQKLVFLSLGFFQNLPFLDPKYNVSSSTWNMIAWYHSSSASSYGNPLRYSSTASLIKWVLHLPVSLEMHAKRLKLGLER